MNIQKLLKEFTHKIHSLNQEMKMKRIEVVNDDDETKLLIDGNAFPISINLDSKLLLDNTNTQDLIKSSVFKVLEKSRKILEDNSKENLIPKELQNIIKSNNKMQNLAKNLENKYKSKIYLGISSGSYVEFTMSGKNEPLTLEINKEVLKDKELLEDLLLSAIKNAYEKQEKESSNLNIF